MPSAILAAGVGKRYRVRTAAHQDGSRVRPRLRGFWALRDITFDLDKGRSMGLVGPNGAGKSTLLRLVAGVGRPDEGRVDATGRVAAILELGTGFHQELTGRESAVLAGVIAGLTRREVNRRMDEIISFAELERFIDAPIRTYSSGMVSRLAFAIATSADPEILLVDEFLAVGDLAFQERCRRRIESFRSAGTTLLLVSHHPSELVPLCDEVLWMQAGRIVARGSPLEVSQRYEAAMAEKGRRLTPTDAPEASTPEGVALRVHENRFGTQEAQIISVLLLDGEGKAANEIPSGSALVIDVKADVPPELGDVRLGIRLVRDDGVVCLDSSTKLPADETRTRSARLELDRVDLLGGRYAFEVGLYSDEWERPYDFHWRAYGLRILGETAGAGVLAAPSRWISPADRSP